MNVIEAAKAAGMKASIGRTDKDGKYHPDVNALASSVPIEWLERFAQIIRNQALEDAAACCDEESLQAVAAWKLAYHPEDQGREIGADNCATSIRSMKKEQT